MMGNIDFMENTTRDLIFIHSYNEVSNRYAILCEEAKVAYLYLSKVGEQAPERDAVAYMRIVAPKKAELIKDEPPILSAEFVSSDAVLVDPVSEKFSFKWSDDGEAVTLLYDNSPITLSSSAEKLGYSKAVIKSNPIVLPWSEERYYEIFF